MYFILKIPRGRYGRYLPSVWYHSLCTYKPDQNFWRHEIFPHQIFAVLEPIIVYGSSYATLFQYWTTPALSKQHLLKQYWKLHLITKAEVSSTHKTWPREAWEAVARSRVRDQAQKRPRWQILLPSENKGMHHDSRIATSSHTMARLKPGKKIP